MNSLNSVLIEGTISDVNRVAELVIFTVTAYREGRPPLMVSCAAAGRLGEYVAGRTPPCEARIVGRLDREGPNFGLRVYAEHVEFKPQKRPTPAD